MRKLFCLILFIGIFKSVIAQDTLLLLTGRKIIVSSVDLSNNTIAYKKLKPDSKVKTIDPERVFSVIYKDGKERIIYQIDSLDPIDFKVEEMRNFIYGEIDASDLYKNNLIKVVGLGIGAGSAYFAIYGLAVPAIYATVVGSFSPSIEKKLTFNVSGSAAKELGITEGTYLNTISGTASSPVIKKDQKLKIASTTFKFKEDLNLDSVVSMVNSKFKCTRVHAANDNGKLKLYKSNFPNLLNDDPYREGFEKKARDYKIRNAMVSGLIGFVAGFAIYKAAFD